MSLRDDLSADAAEFLDEDGFAEEITYTPHEELGKTMIAIVERSPATNPQLADMGPRSLKTNRIELWIANSATLGVTSVKKGFDRVTLPFPENGPNVEFTVTKVLNSDPGMFHVEAEA